MDEADIEAKAELVRSLLRGLRLHQGELAYHRQEVARLQEELAQLLTGATPPTPLAAPGGSGNGSCPR